MTQASRHLTYITSARMPTEKAHGVSIAHMCAAFAAEGYTVELVVPTRRNAIHTDIYSYYGVPATFTIRRVPTIDFVGAGYTHPLFYALQRVLFARAAKKAGIENGIVYTREPEIVAMFGVTHTAVYEAHRFARGFSGVCTAWLLRRAACIVANSRGTMDALAKKLSNPVVVAPNGFDPSLFVKAAQTREALGLPEGTLALYAGSLLPWKGVEVLVRAAEDLPKDLLSVVILGGAKKDRNGTVVYLGSVPSAQVPEYLAAADILVLPNTNDTEESQRFTSPIKLFEYLAAGKAIIASDLPSIREIVSENEVVFVPAGDADALRQALRELSTHSELRGEKAAQAKKLSERYTWGARAHTILEQIRA